MKPIKMKSVVALPLLASLCACGDPLKDAQLLEETRAIGVRIATESGRATPEIGEEVAVSFLFAGPGGPASLRVAYEICLSTDSARGVPSCIEAPYLEGVVNLGEPGAEPSFVVPEDAPRGARAVVHVVGCEQGEPKFAPDPLDWSCEGGGEPLSVSFDFWIFGEVHNGNPDLTSAFVTLEGEDVPLQDPSVAVECSADTPRVPRGESYDLRLSLGEGARETLPSGEVEILQISHFSTAGLLERQFSIVDGAEGAEVTVPWEAPDEAGPVKQYAVVRDGRGGVTWISFGVCVD